METYSFVKFIKFEQILFANCLMIWSATQHIGPYKAVPLLSWYKDNMASYNIFLLVLVSSSAFMILEANGKLSLSPTHYSTTCPNVLSIVNEAVIEAINKETRIGASLLRLHFHDCFVNVSI